MKDLKKYAERLQTWLISDFTAVKGIMIMLAVGAIGLALPLAIASKYGASDATNTGIAITGFLLIMLALSLPFLKKRRNEVQNRTKK